MGGTTTIALLAALAVAAACNKDEGKSKPDKATAASPSDRQPADAPQNGDPVAESTQTRVIEAPPPPELHAEPVERRLYSDRIEASSFLWTDWNRFQENYHPNYIVDGDDATAWVEGADSDGVGEWIRLHVSPIQGATAVRLRIHNGYHKSKALYRKNARIQEMDIVTLPGGHSHRARLADTMDWHEVAFEHQPATIEAIELRVASVYAGSKYTDLCVSDVELFVTGLNVENPAFEKTKLDEIRAWKKNRLAAAELLGSAEAKNLPIKPAYRVASSKNIDEPEVPTEGENTHLRGQLAAAGSAAGAEFAEYFARAERALANDFADWVRVQVTSKKPLRLPDVDGLHNTPDWVLAFDVSEHTFYMPSYGNDQSLLLSSRLTMFDEKGGDPRQREQCKAGEAHFMRPPRDDNQSPNPRQLLMARCVGEETREGEATYLAWQLLDYDDKGRLRLVSGGGTVTWFDWDEQQSVVTGATRLLYGRQIQKLTDAQVVAAD